MISSTISGIKCAVFALIGLVLIGIASADRPASAPKEITVACASNMIYAMEGIVTEFQKRHSTVSVRMSYGSSGNFFSQISNRAPFDLFFSADTIYPQKVCDAGLCLDGDQKIYATGRLVLWALSGSSISVERLGIQSLSDTAIRHIALANPKVAPYGRAADEALRHFGIHGAVKDKLVFGEDISQTTQFVQSGSAEVGFLAMGVALSPVLSGKGRFWPIPAGAHSPLDHGVVIMKWCKDKSAAKAFRSFVLGAGGRKILRQFGFGLPVK